MEYGQDNEVKKQEIDTYLGRYRYFIWTDLLLNDIYECTKENLDHISTYNSHQSGAHLVDPDVVAV